MMPVHRLCSFTTTITIDNGGEHNICGAHNYAQLSSYFTAAER
jgi:hypothetical protein